jgi:superfamily I DNA/RNA helicase
MPEIATLSVQQGYIESWFRKDPTFHVDYRRHLIVKARAGTGKSSTIRHCVKQAPEKNILIAAFSKDIQLEMERKITPFHNGRVQTLHSVGLSCVRMYRDRIGVAFNSDRADALALRVCGTNTPDSIIRLVSKLHTKGREIAPHAKELGDLTDIAITFDCEPEDQWANAGFDTSWVERKALEAMELAANVQAGTVIDGSDMIFLPVRNRWLTPQYDMVVVDEAQDMTVAQLEVAQGVMKRDGRMCIVGDDRQGIFAFRGADSESLGRLKNELDAIELGLTVTYRCGKRIVELAQELVEDIEAHESNPEGEILHIGSEELTPKAGPGDFILSRVNAPLVSIAMQLLKQGKRTRILGRDIGKGLITLVKKMRANSVPDFLRKVENWSNREVNRLNEQKAEAKSESRKNTIQSKIEGILDQAEMLTELAAEAKNIDKIIEKITALFSDDGLGEQGVITCSSIHRAKGKEAKRVFILSDTLRDYNLEEQNLQYVAITRAKETLVFVRSR